MTKQNYIKYRNQWYNTASLDAIIKHITKGIKVIDVTEDITEDVTDYKTMLLEQLELNNELEDIIDSYNN